MPEFWEKDLEKVFHPFPHSQNYFPVGQLQRPVPPQGCPNGEAEHGSLPVDCVRSHPGEEEVKMGFLKHAGTHAVIPAMPAHPFIFIDEANKLLNASRGGTTGMPLLFNQCLFSSCKLNRVPLKLDPANIPPLLRHVLKDNGRPLHNFFPGGVTNDNIGSNAGTGR